MRLSRLHFQRHFSVLSERRFITQSEEQSPLDSNKTSLIKHATLLFCIHLKLTGLVIEIGIFK